MDISTICPWWATVTAAERPLVLLDRSLGMLARAAKRLHGHDPARVCFRSGRSV